MVLSCGHVLQLKSPESPLLSHLDLTVMDVYSKQEIHRNELIIHLKACSNEGGQSIWLAIMVFASQLLLFPGHEIETKEARISCQSLADSAGHLQLESAHAWLQSPDEHLAGRVPRCPPLPPPPLLSPSSQLIHLSFQERVQQNQSLQRTVQLCHLSRW